ncbi:MAG: hypothetical protein HOP12_02440 [Candidatus Eisenbacteria bacterium]|uniref:Coenzyme Q-binding protein COQ10 START domain-containing protein n=1 Tax=Eiseniibacteriota bacterium TaxID=2212470 RepID=A0A849SBF6_UNCEI|nr:hypothetical protein [Candidatus Eisenbacteria bacterium]
MIRTTLDLMLPAMISLAAIVALATPTAGADDLATVERATASVHRGPNGLEVQGRVRVTASQAIAWAVLTDYDSIDRFVSSMRESRIVGWRDGDVLVEQLAEGRLLLFKRLMRTTLKVHEEPPARIVFEDVLRKDFEHYRGEWRIDDHGAEVEIIYLVQARPNRSIPEFIAHGMFQRTVRQLLSEVAREVASRAALAARQP